MTVDEAVIELKSYIRLYGEAEDLRRRMRESEYKLRSMGVYRMSDLPMNEKKDAADAWAKAFDEIKRLEDIRVERITEALRRAREIEAKASSVKYPFGRILVLKYIDGLSNRAIARRINYNCDYIRAMLQQAKTLYAEK